MVREARFSWDDVDRFDPALRHERTDDFNGPDDDWVAELKPARRRKRRKRRAERPAPPQLGSPDSAQPVPPGSPPAGRTMEPGSSAAPAARRRHLADADWLNAPPDDGRRAAHGDHEDRRRSVLPRDLSEHPDDRS